MENQIPEEIKAQRSGVLSSLESQMTKEFRTKWTGACVKVLLEERQEINGVSYMVGHTPEYIKCAVETDAPDNTIIDAIIEGELTADVMKARQREMTVQGTPIRKTARSVRRCKTRTKFACSFVLFIKGRPLRPADS